MTSRITRRRLVAAAAQLPILSALKLPLAAPARAQMATEMRALPADATLDQLYSESGLVVLVIGGPAGGFLQASIEAQRVYMQSFFWSYRLMAEDAYLRAWMTNSLAEVTKFIRMATAAARRYYEIIDGDVAWWRDRYSRILIPRADLNAVERGAKAQHDALLELRAELDRAQLKQLADSADQKFNTIRETFIRIGTMPHAGRIQNTRELAAVMGSLARVSAYVDALMTAVHAASWPLEPAEWRRRTQPAQAAAVPPPRPNEPARIDPPTDPPPPSLVTPLPQPVVPFPGQQVRVAFTNESTSLVFFVRLHSLQPDRSFSPRPDTVNWLPIYPKDATMPAAIDSDPTSNQARESPLPNTLWLPSRPGDKIELRVATYGEHRKRIRWLVVRGTTIQLALDGLLRSYYWLHYEQRRSDRAGDQLSQLMFPTRESYQWNFIGLWEAGTQWETTPINTLRESPERTYPLALERDHMTWTLPTGMDTIRGQPTLEARVQGTATYTRIGPTSRQRVDDLSEAGSGSLTVQMTQW
jgi:hypothetical protein